MGVLINRADRRLLLYAVAGRSVAITVCCFSGFRHGDNLKRLNSCAKVSSAFTEGK